MNEIILFQILFSLVKCADNKNHTKIINGNQIYQPIEVWIWSLIDLELHCVV